MTPDDASTVNAYRSGWSEIMELVRTGGAWSGHERTCCFLNTGQTRFANVSGISGIDFPDDGRCVAPVDWDHDGDLDLWLSARTGPVLRFVRNNSEDEARSVAFRLEGTQCNRNAIGARIEVTVDGEKLIRTAHAGDGYLAQASKWIHFGMGKREVIERVAVRWPGGDAEEFSGVDGDGLFVLRQGGGAAARWQPPQRSVELQPSQLATIEAERATRIVVQDRVPMANLSYEEAETREMVSILDSGSTANAESVESTGSVPADDDRVLLINLWASWCVPCLAELKEFSEKADKLRAAGIDVVALNVESAGKDAEDAVPKARELLAEQIRFPFRSGFATPELLERLDVLQEVLLTLRPEKGQLPSSFLVDRSGRLRLIYSGKVSVEQIIRDSRLVEESSDFHLPFAGRWINEPVDRAQVLIDLSEEFQRRNIRDEALRYGSLATDVSSRDRISQDDRLKLATLFFDTGLEQLQEKDFDQAVRNLQEAVRLRPDWAEAHANLGSACRMTDRLADAERHFLSAVKLNPDLIPPHFGLGLIYLQSRRNQKAADHFFAVTQIEPGFSEGYHQLGIALLRLGRKQDGLSRIQHALRLDPGNGQARQSLAAALRGQTP